MWKNPIRVAGALALVLATAGAANAAGINIDRNIISGAAGLGIVQKVHSLDEAEYKLQRHGYYEIVVERSSLPYSFRACKRGQRYHIHLNYYGDFEQVDQIGYCGGYGSRYDNDDDYGRRRYYGRRSYDGGQRWQYRRARDYYFY